MSSGEKEGRRDGAGNGRSTINPSPPLEGVRSQPPAGAKGEPVPGRRVAGGTGTRCRAGAAAAGASAAQLRAHRGERPGLRGSGPSRLRPAGLEETESRNAF